MGQSCCAADDGKDQQQRERHGPKSQQQRQQDSEASKALARARLDAFEQEEKRKQIERQRDEKAAAAEAALQSPPPMHPSFGGSSSQRSRDGATPLGTSRKTTSSSPAPLNESKNSLGGGSLGRPPPLGGDLSSVGPSAGTPRSSGGLGIRRKASTTPLGGASNSRRASIGSDGSKASTASGSVRLPDGPPVAYPTPVATVDDSMDMPTPPPLPAPLPESLRPAATAAVRQRTPTPTASANPGINSGRSTPAAGYTSRAKPLTATPSQPLPYQLAMPVKSIDEIMVQCTRGVSCENKVDGERVQVITHGETVTVFNRSMKSVPPYAEALFGTLMSALNLSVASCVLDCELVLPGHAGGAIKLDEADHDAASSTKMILHVFDLINLNGKSLLLDPFEKRRSSLQSILEPVLDDPHTEIRLTEVEMLVDASPEERMQLVKKCLSNAIAAGQEGIVCKDTTAQYLPGQRARWFKLKKDYIYGMGSDTVDLLVLGAYVDPRSKGSPTPKLQSFLMGIADERIPSGGAKRFKTVCKVGLGFPERVMSKLNERYAKRMKPMNGPPNWSDIPADLMPDLFTRAIESADVFEVAGAEFTVTSKHSSGVSIRFPRVLKIRSDKDHTGATTMVEFLQIVQSTTERRQQGGIPLNDSAHPNARRRSVSAESDQESAGIAASSSPKPSAAVSPDTDSLHPPRENSLAIGDGSWSPSTSQLHSNSRSMVGRSDEVGGSQRRTSSSTANLGSEAVSMALPDDPLLSAHDEVADSGVVVAPPGGADEIQPASIIAEAIATADKQFAALRKQQQESFEASEQRLQSTIASANTAFGVEKPKQAHQDPTVAPPQQQQQTPENKAIRPAGGQLSHQASIDLEALVGLTRQTTEDEIERIEREDAARMASARADDAFAAFEARAAEQMRQHELKMAAERVRLEAHDKELEEKAAAKGADPDGPPISTEESAGKLSVERDSPAGDLEVSPSNRDDSSDPNFLRATFEASSETALPPSNSVTASFDVQHGGTPRHSPDYVGIEPRATPTQISLPQSTTSRESAHASVDEEFSPPVVRRGTLPPPSSLTSSSGGTGMTIRRKPKASPLSTPTHAALSETETASTPKHETETDATPAPEVVKTADDDGEDEGFGFRFDNQSVSMAVPEPLEEGDDEDEQEQPAAEAAPTDPVVESAPESDPATDRLTVPGVLTIRRRSKEKRGESVQKTPEPEVLPEDTAEAVPGPDAPSGGDAAAVAVADDGDEGFGFRFDNRSVSMAVPEPLEEGDDEEEQEQEQLAAEVESAPVPQPEASSAEPVVVSGGLTIRRRSKEKKGEPAASAQPVIVVPNISSGSSLQSGSPLDNGENSRKSTSREEGGAENNGSEEDDDDEYNSFGQLRMAERSISMSVPEPGDANFEEHIRDLATSNMISPDLLGALKASGSTSVSASTHLSRSSGSPSRHHTIDGGFEAAAVEPEVSEGAFPPVRQETAQPNLGAATPSCQSQAEIVQPADDDGDEGFGFRFDNQSVSMAVPEPLEEDDEEEKEQPAAEAAPTDPVVESAPESDPATDRLTVPGVLTIRRRSKEKRGESVQKTPEPEVLPDTAEVVTVPEAPSGGDAAAAVPAEAVPAPQPESGSAEPMVVSGGLTIRRRSKEKKGESVQQVSEEPVIPEDRPEVKPEASKSDDASGKQAEEDGDEGFGFRFDNQSVSMAVPEPLEEGDDEEEQEQEKLAAEVESAAVPQPESGSAEPVVVSGGLTIRRRSKEKKGESVQQALVSAVISESTVNPDVTAHAVDDSAQNGSNGHDEAVPEPLSLAVPDAVNDTEIEDAHTKEVVPSTERVVVSGGLTVRRRSKEKKGESATTPSGSDTAVADPIDAATPEFQSPSDAIESLPQTMNLNGPREREATAAPHGEQTASRSPSPSPALSEESDFRVEDVAMARMTAEGKAALLMRGVVAPPPTGGGDFSAASTSVLSRADTEGMEFGSPNGSVEPMSNLHASNNAVPLVFRQSQLRSLDSLEQHMDEVPHGTAATAKEDASSRAEAGTGNGEAEALRRFPSITSTVSNGSMGSDPLHQHPRVGGKKVKSKRPGHKNVQEAMDEGTRAVMEMSRSVSRSASPRSTSLASTSRHSSFSDAQMALHQNQGFERTHSSNGGVAELVSPVQPQAQVLPPPLPPAITRKNSPPLVESTPPPSKTTSECKRHELDDAGTTEQE